MPSVKEFSPAAKAIIHEAARKCFGNLPIVNYRTGFKILRQMPIGPLANNFPVDPTHAYKKLMPTFTTELEERRIDKLDRLRRAGKGPPKKGQGKRSKKTDKDKEKEKEKEKEKGTTVV
jgi:small subunit ribosomal protein S33